ncbi:hypothetical protein ScPMuIL_015534 [Solemya velum]
MGDWQYGLFGCFNDIGLCIITYFVPCYTAGKNAEAVGESCITYGILSILGPCGIYFRAKIRGQIRDQKSIPGGMGGDCLLHWFCAICALIQEAQEVKGPGGAMAQSMARE